jgi:hypothetical protein
MQDHTAHAIDEMIEKLLALPAKDPKQQKLDKQASVKRMVQALTTLQERGYTIEDIVLSLKGVGFDITTPTLKTYLQRARNPDDKRPNKKRPPPRRAHKTDAPTAPAVDGPSMDAPSDSSAERAAKRTANAANRTAKSAAPTGGAVASTPAATPTPPGAGPPETEPPLRSGRDAFLLTDKASY